jgi:hypothetical protein
LIMVGSYRIVGRAPARYGEPDTDISHPPA